MQALTQPSALAHAPGRKMLYEPLDFLQVRAPLFPVEAYLALHDPASTLETGLHSENPLVRRALAVGSIALLDELERASSSTRDIVRRERKLLRYLTRMATRPTPYGLFAGVALAHWDEQTDLSIASGPRWISTRPDMKWLLTQAWRLETLPEVRQHLHYCANTAAYARRGRIFLLEQLDFGQPQRSEAVSLRATRTALHALRLARQPIFYSALVEALLTATPGATVAQVEGLIATLWQHTLLFTDLHPPLTSDSPAHYLLKRLERIPATASLAVLLRDYLDAIEQWDHMTDEAGSENYRALLQRARHIEGTVDELVNAGKPAWTNSTDAKKPSKSSTMLQVDTSVALNGSVLARSIGEEAAQAAELMLRLSPLPRGLRHLQAFRHAFQERYGLEREVPLVELLDPHVGLGIPSTTPAEGERWLLSEPPESPERKSELTRLALTALRERQLVVSLSEEQLQRLETVSPSSAPLPPSLDVYVLLATTSRQALDRGEYQLVIGPNIGATQAGRNLGRFAHMLGAQALQALTRAAEHDAAFSPHVLLAEVVYQHSEARTANVALRPGVHSHEVIYGVMPGVDAANTIPLDELVVGIRGERFYVRWPAKQREVRFRAGHMLNVLQAPAIIRFLSELSYDGVPMISHFGWGAYADFPFLPRIQIGRIVLSLAQWSLSTTFHLPEFVLTTSEQFHESLESWRKHWLVPRYVYLGEGDNRLLLDLESSVQAEELRTALRELKDGQTVKLQEALPGPEHAWLEGPGGHYLTEYVVSLSRRQAEVQAQSEEISHAPVSEQIERLRPPGSEWLFMKLYCTETLQADLIAGPIRTFVGEALAQHLAEDWFFIRYRDPEPHIRLRFKGDPHTMTTQLLPALCAWGTQLLSDSPCTNFTFDVYDREIERYGGPLTMAASEALFCADSAAISEILYLKQKKTLPIELTTLAVLTTDDLISTLGQTPAQRLHWARTTSSNARQFGTVYRQKSTELRLLLNTPEYLRQLNGGEQLAEILDRRRARLAEVAQQFTEAASKHALNQASERIYRSFFHMHCNRLFGIDREIERQVMELLRRTWLGLLQG